MVLYTTKYLFIEAGNAAKESDVCRGTLRDAYSGNAAATIKFIHASSEGERHLSNKSNHFYWLWINDRRFVGNASDCDTAMTLHFGPRQCSRMKTHTHTPSAGVPLLSLRFDYIQIHSHRLADGSHIDEARLRVRNDKRFFFLFIYILFENRPREANVLARLCMCGPFDMLCAL